MNQKVIKEIDHNLYIRKDLKIVFDGFKMRYYSITNVNRMLIELKFDFIQKGVYEDIYLFLFYLRNINYLNFSELRYIIQALNASEKEYFREDSAEMKKQIDKVSQKLKVTDLNNHEEIDKLYSACKDCYERYVLQRALFKEDVLVGMGNY